MNFLKDNQKYPHILKLNRCVKNENGIHVSKSSGGELCPNDSNRPFVNGGRYHNEDKSCMEAW